MTALQAAHHRRLRLGAKALLSLSVWASAATPSLGAFSVSLLAFPVGSDSLDGYSTPRISGNGQVVTGVAGARGYAAAVWGLDGAPRLLEPTLGSQSMPTAINDLGDVIGWATDVAGMTAAGYLVRRTGDVTYFPLSPSYDPPWSMPEAMNNVGGMAFKEARALRVVRGPDEVRYEFPSDLAARQMNDAGAVVGFYGVPAGNLDGRFGLFVADTAGLWLVPSIGGLFDVRGGGINLSGTVVGRVEPSMGQRAESDTFAAMPPQGFALDPDGTIHWLPGVGDSVGSVANGINDAGLVVGTSFAADGTPTATLWESGAAIDLNAFSSGLREGWWLAGATGISNGGRVVALALSPTGERQLAVLTVPEPSRVASMAPLLFMLSRRSRRR